MIKLAFGLVLSLVFALAMQAQDKGVAWATYSMHGLVQSVRTETSDVVQKDGKNIEGPRIVSMTIEFNEDGGRPELAMYDAKGNLARRIVMRYEGKKQVEFLNYDGAGRMWLRGTSLYDAEGRTIENATYNGDGSLRSKTTITRDAQGRVIETNEVDPKGSPMDKIRYTLNSAGEIATLERSYYEPPGAIHLKEVHNIAEKRSEFYWYDRDGSLVNTDKRVNQEINSYAPNGTLVKNTILTDAGKLPDEMIVAPNGSTRKESQVPDEIDPHGNWTRQTKWVTDSQGTRPVKITYRRITYFGERREVQP
jgi:hypothetical protein